MGTDFGNLIRHAGTASDAVDQALGAFQHTVQNGLGRRHFPQHIHVDAALAVRRLMRHARLSDTALDRKIDQLVVAFPPRTTLIDHRKQAALVVIAVGIDAGKRANTAGSSPGAGAFAVRYGDALAPFNERQYLTPGHDNGIECLHGILSALS